MFIVVDSKGYAIAHGGGRSEARADARVFGSYRKAERWIEELKHHDRADAAMMGNDMAEHEFPVYHIDEIEEDDCDCE